MTPPSILWFRRDLRLDDNPAARAAGRGFWPVFILDPETEAQGAASKWRLARAIEALDRDLRAQGARLACFIGQAKDVLPKITPKGAAVHVNRWPYAPRRAADRAAYQALADHEARLIGHDGHTLLPTQTVRRADGGEYAVYSAFARGFHRLHPDLTPEGAAPPAATDMPALQGEVPLPRILDRLDHDMNRGAEVLARHSLGAGAGAARDRLADFLDRDVADYAQGRDKADRNVTSTLAEALAVGEISPRRIWAETERITDPAKAKGAGKFLAELLWREFAWSLLAARPDMDRETFHPEWADFPWHPDLPTRWQQAWTGEAMVDAGLREMFVTGRMHNRVRMIVASYLTKHLLRDWRTGLAWFAECLTDWDPASNAMNWQWVAGCGPDAAPYFRVFNPALQAEKFDTKGHYRRRWLSSGGDGDDYFAAIPRSWDVPRDYARVPAMIDLAEGRQAALAAYHAFRRSKSSD